MVFFKRFICKVIYFLTIAEIGRDIHTQKKQSLPNTFLLLAHHNNLAWFCFHLTEVMKFAETTKKWLNVFHLTALQQHLIHSTPKSFIEIPAPRATCGAKIHDFKPRFFWCQRQYEDRRSSFRSVHAASIIIYRISQPTILTQNNELLSNSEIQEINVNLMPNQSHCETK